MLNKKKPWFKTTTLNAHFSLLHWCVLRIWRIHVYNRKCPYAKLLEKWVEKKSKIYLQLKTVCLRCVYRRFNFWSLHKTRKNWLILGIWRLLLLVQCCGVSRSCYTSRKVTPIFMYLMQLSALIILGRGLSYQCTCLEPILIKSRLNTIQWFNTSFEHRLW